jgi:AcrR family transcriptional regulator
LDAAAEVFEERGFSGASLSDILARAGVTKGALYFHFASKEELANAIIEEQWNIDIPPVGTASLQGLIDLCHEFGKNLCTNVRVSASNRLVTETNISRPAPAVYDRWIEILRVFVVSAQADGDIRKEWDPDAVAVWVAGTILGVQTLSGVRTNRKDLRDRITDLWKIALPGLVPARRLARFAPDGTIQWDDTSAA